MGAEEIRPYADAHLSLPDRRDARQPHQNTGQQGGAGGVRRAQEKACIQLVQLHMAQEKTTCRIRMAEGIQQLMPLLTPGPGGGRIAALPCPGEERISRGDAKPGAAVTAHIRADGDRQQQCFK